MRWYKPEVDLRWNQWLAGIEFHDGLVYLHLGPVQVVW